MTFPLKKIFQSRILITIVTISVNINFVTSQSKGIVINQQTKEPIPYVNIWVEDENIGTTSDELGNFDLQMDSSKFLVFSAIGFKNKRARIDVTQQIIELIPTAIELDEIVVKSSRSDREIKIDKFKKSKINLYFACGKTPLIAAKYFEYKQKYRQTPFLKEIKVLTTCDIEKAKFNVRLQAKDKDGKPGKYLYEKNIIGIAEKGKKKTTVDLSNLNIPFPENGVFIAIESLIIKENEHEELFTYNKGSDSERKVKRIMFEPSIGMIPKDTDENSWTYGKGKWRKMWKHHAKMASKRYRNKYSQLAIELTLKN